MCRGQEECKEFASEDHLIFTHNKNIHKVKGRGKRALVYLEEEKAVGKVHEVVGPKAVIEQE